MDKKRLKMTESTVVQQKIIKHGEMQRRTPKTSVGVYNRRIFTKIEPAQISM
jgi:hypothetical protein